MALLEDVAEGASSPNVVVGVAAGLFASTLAPAVVWILRPAAKLAVRTGIAVYDRAVAPVGAAITQLVNEAQQELAAGSAEPPSGTTPEPAKSSARAQKRGGAQR